MPNIRIKKGGAYAADIAALCNAIRANGTAQNLTALTVSNSLTATTINLYLNLSYQSNSSAPLANGSLYTVGFGNANGIWQFTIAGVPMPVGGVAFPGVGGIDGTYASLGYPAAPFPALTDANIAAAINTIAAYNGGATNAALKDAMAKIIICVSEAARLTEIFKGVSGVLGNANNYVPSYATIHAWGGHVLSN